MPNSIWFGLYEMPRIGKFIETEKILGVAKGWGRGKWKVTANV